MDVSYYPMSTSTTAPKVFPQSIHPTTNAVMGGMDLRDYFAGQVIAGWCETHHGLAVDLRERYKRISVSSEVLPYHDAMAAVAFGIADAMMRWRSDNTHESTHL